MERQAGVTKSTFQIGDHLFVIGSPSRDSTSHEVTLVEKLRRPQINGMAEHDGVREAVVTWSRKKKEALFLLR